MARRRYQSPTPKIEGKWWVLYYWKDVFEDRERKRKRTRERLAPSSMAERETLKVPQQQRLRQPLPINHPGTSEDS